ncbi:glycine--tRNA ligase subunit beta [Aliidiomarina taiwanensis]|uniref:Glycine--tRNA ligase beta subunit n=1 Tax=Aliidiomarina taiwanensis TaxID=946228 RepID=A0A432X8F1_9GAMM|nr:glycine--tRNA ligase subunit beta [Aliidiomarina taiwanensis]RUO43683.1 glycine--tRNA ligase subunit beta [Aliidiomarina taiwanensis]
MSTTANLLIELGTEELPPKSLKALSDSFTQSITDQLTGLSIAFGKVESFATPRRIAVLVSHVQRQQDDEQVDKRGPAIAAAFDAEGNPTKAALGWARGVGIDVADAERLVTDKGEWLLHKAIVPGKDLQDLLPQVVQQAAKQLPVPKTMRWGEGEFAFIRPLKRLTVMLDDTLVPMSLFGVQSSNRLLGHRFHSQGDVELTKASDYPEALKQAYVIASFAERRQLVKEHAQALAADINATPVWDEDLLDEVASLVEWPVALLAAFDEAFLDVPKEALIYTMKDDQRYFPLVDSEGNLLAKFIFITNIESKNPDLVVAGNEKVIRPRLADAEFFYTNDKKVSLASRIEKLDSVLFQKELGSIGDKARRISQVAGNIANQLGADAAIATRAGLLAKADLVSHMVMEFPEVQGVMGMHYARHDGEPEGVALAIEAHYRPRFAGDTLPSTTEGAAVAIADKLDTLVGIFAIGQTPRGDRDPFGLRRAAIGLLRMLVELELDLDFKAIIAHAAGAYASTIQVSEETQDEIFNFLLGRFRAWYQEQGIAVDVIQSVLARRPQKALDFDRRVKAVTEFVRLPEAEALAAANKRVSNILAKSDTANLTEINTALLQEEAEKALYDALNGLQSTVETGVASGNYNAVLSQLAHLRSPIDNFFNEVMVNADEPAIRTNRLALLTKLRNQFLAVADISLLQS